MTLPLAGLFGLMIPMFFAGLCSGAPLDGTGISSLFALGVVLMGAGAFIVLELRQRYRGGALSVVPDVRVGPIVENVAKSATEAFQATDPAFTDQGAIAHVTALFQLLQRALQTGRLELVRPWISDGLFARVTTQFRLHSEASAKELLVDRELDSVVFARFNVGKIHQTLVLRLRLEPNATATERDVRTMMWTFVRRLGAQTPKHSLRDERCPHCAAPIELTTTQRCNHCQAIFNSGEHDWVLVDMLPGSHAFAKRSEVLDVDGLRTCDPSLAIEELEDRVVLTFLRWLEATALGEGHRLSRVTTQAFYDETRPALTARIHQGKRLAVHSAEVRLLRSLPELDEAHALVRWSTGDGPGQTTARQLIARLVRPSGNRTPAQLGFSSLRCSGCLAAMTEAEINACLYCGTPWSHSWSLAGFEEPLDWAQRVTALKHEWGTRAADWSLVPHYERLLALSVAASVARASGSVTPEERAQLERLQQAWKLSQAELAKALESQEPIAVSRERLGRAAALELMRELVEVAFADGAIALTERKLIDRVAASLDLSKETTRLISDRITRHLSRS